MDFNVNGNNRFQPLNSLVVSKLTAVIAGILAGLPYPMMHNVSIREHSEGVPEGATTLQHIVDSKGGGRLLTFRYL